jgi:hypothetical protein
MPNKKLTGLLVLCLFTAGAVRPSLADDLDARVKYNQQKAKWAIEDTRRKIEADRAKIQSQISRNQSGYPYSQSTGLGTQRQSATTAGGAAANRYIQTPMSATSTAAQMEVKQLFQQYKSLDLSNNPQIIGLYADDATIDVLGARHTKATYGQYVATAYRSVGSGLNTHTVYSEPQILSVSNNAAQLKFYGTLGANTMTVNWYLRKTPAGAWQIASERFTNGRQ